jgi:hypothetical protein
MKRFSFCLVSLVALAARPGYGQTPPDAGAFAPAGATAAAARRIPVLFRGLSETDVVRIGPSGAEPREIMVSSEGVAQVDLDPGQTYHLAWGDPSNPDRIAFYLPKPAEGAAPVTPVECVLQRGQQSVPAQVWAYQWSPGEKERLDRLARLSARVAPARPAQPQEPVAAAPVRAPAAPAPSPEPDGRLAGLEANLTQMRDESERGIRLAQLLAGAALLLGLVALGAGIAFYASAWRTHRDATAQALEQTIPRTLRVQNQNITNVTRRLEAACKHWEHDRDTLRRGQELIASHAMARPEEAPLDETADLRREIADLRRQLSYPRGS